MGDNDKGRRNNRGADGLKWVIDTVGWNVIPMNALVTALLSGVFFTVGILLRRRR